MFKKIILKTIKFFLLFISVFLIVVSFYIKKEYNNTSFEQLYYSFMYLEGTSFSSIKGGLIFFTVSFLIVFIILNLIVYIINKIFKHKIINNKIQVIFLFFLLVFSLLFSIKTLKIDSFLNKKNTEIFNENYIDPKTIELDFPTKKRNLIYIYMESMEATNFSKENGGGLEVSYIPNLEELALSNINFSNTDKLGGALPIYGTTWTIGAMVAQTSGIPLKIPIDVNSYKNYGEFLGGAYSIGDILDANGYNNYLLIGSNANFGGRKDYFTYHGNYQIFDYYYAIREKLISSDYYVWWGYEDNKLYSYAKKLLKQISKQDEPFNFTMLTADTHFPNGYVDSSCNKKFDTNYANSFYCSDGMVYKFLNWIQKQEFYKNTTIVIVGDHLSMEKDLYKDIIDEDYQRNIYNVIINSKIQSNNTKERLFTSFDMYPTTLASLGIKIEGNKLGLGTNLFSSEKTLLEKFGYDYVEKELMKKSDFYNKYIIGASYVKLLEDSKKS